MAAAAPQENHRPVKSSARTLEILEYLAAGHDQRSLGEIARDLGFPKSSLHAILRTMQDMGWIQVDETGTRFGLGVRSLLVGASYVDSDDVVSRTSDALDQLADEIGETAHLGRLDGSDIIYLAKRESRHPLRMFSAIGRRLPAHATALGKAILATFPPERVRAALPGELQRLTPQTIVDHDALQRELAATRERGYAIDNQENTEGIRCIAVPITHDGTVNDAISCSVPVVRMTPEFEAAIVAAMLDTQRQAEANLRSRHGS